MHTTTLWNIEKARHTYSLPYWSNGYVDVNETGNLHVYPRGGKTQGICLPTVVEQAQEQGLRLPLLVRFVDILSNQRDRLQQAFAAAMTAMQYTGGYTAIYPIKVNQQASVVREFVQSNVAGFGLEAGSKPELVAVLALSQPGSVIICNGYKDREFIRLALCGKKLGLNVFIVIEKPSELEIALSEAQALGIEPQFGVRMRLSSLGAGKWQNTGGDKAKFGLSPRQLLNLITTLREKKLLHTLKLLHFHMGSQISNVRDIAQGMREAVRYWVEIANMGVNIQYMDVGGGLGIDYEGTRSRSFCSINYNLEQYANTIVEPLAAACQQYQLAPPHILTEAGRAMTAHHAVLITQVNEVEHAPKGAVPPIQEAEPLSIRHLRDVIQQIDQRPALELYHEAQHYFAEGQSLYAHGMLSLTQRALLDDLFYAVAHLVRARLKTAERAHRETLDDLNEKLVDKYFVNFSVFQSIPDVWALEQVFPIVPINRLLEAPTCHGVIADLTCDSDGRIDHYVDSEGVDTSLPLHALQENKPYYLGLFLVGAYQETLGDMHNLFGDTDSVNVRLTAEGYALTECLQGDSTARVLQFVGYDANELLANFQKKMALTTLDKTNIEQINKIFNTGLKSYTYLQVDHAY